MFGFSIFGTQDEKLRIKSFSGASKGGKHTISIVIEAADTYDFGRALRDLEDTQKAQNSKPDVPPKPRQKG